MSPLRELCPDPGNGTNRNRIWQDGEDFSKNARRKYKMIEAWANDHYLGKNYLRRRRMDPYHRKAYRSKPYHRKPLSSVRR